MLKCSHCVCFLVVVAVVGFLRGALITGRTYELLLDAEVDVGEVMEVRFRWNNHIIDPLRPKYGAEKVVLQRGKDKKM